VRFRFGMREVLGGIARGVIYDTSGKLLDHMFILFMVVQVFDGKEISLLKFSGLHVMIVDSLDGFPLL
jgi:hypothetical protein